VLALVPIQIDTGFVDQVEAQVEAPGRDRVA